jgi:hypothetical protein
MTGAGLDHFAGVWETALVQCSSAGLDYGPTPTKLYLAIVSVVAALSKRNESFDFDL